jgi:hypothetical protein
VLEKYLGILFRLDEPISNSMKIKYLLKPFYIASTKRA